MLIGLVNYAKVVAKYIKTWHKYDIKSYYCQLYFTLSRTYYMYICDKIKCEQYRYLVRI